MRPLVKRLIIGCDGALMVFGLPVMCGGMIPDRRRNFWEWVSGTGRSRDDC